MIRDPDCVAFLQWALPRLGLRWPGYRKVRGLVRKRLARRLATLDLADLGAYVSHLATHAEEWNQLEAICHIPISRFCRDKQVFDVISNRVLPDIAEHAAAAGSNTIRCWSAGCASGEEPYSLSIIWVKHIALKWPALRLSVIATDADETMLQRAAAACYSSSSLKELPASWREDAFTPEGGLFCLKPEFRKAVEFRMQDLRVLIPDGTFQLMLCRNLAFTYFDLPTQQRIFDRMVTRLAAEGYLVIGKHEALPVGASGLVPLVAGLPIYRRP